MHIFIFWGFTGLLIMHALDGLIILPLFPDYSPCLNPFLFLRNFFGFTALAGIFMAAWRRIRTPVLRKTTRKSDWTALVLLFLIISSGIVLESVKILSPEIFYDMADSYLVIDDPADLTWPDCKYTNMIIVNPAIIISVNNATVILLSSSRSIYRINLPCLHLEF